jgi:16S rRNA A1518/A1519 N6-dimethyltransferase RsmA/KsgA/DIM1 with predicted DNA glycosylase/AP lyase activity
MRRARRSASDSISYGSGVSTVSSMRPDRGGRHTVLEIGPGHGAGNVLADRGARVVAVEVDRDLARCFGEIRQRFG